MTKLFTRSEVAACAGQKSKPQLIILHDKVYDVYSFLNEHPGGEEILLDHAGKDGSEDFDDVGHSQDAFDLMKNYLVGELVESERTNRSPKKSWTMGSSKDSKKQDDGLSSMIAAGAIAALLAIVYFVYL